MGLSRRELQLRKHDVDGKELWSRQLRISENGRHVIAGLAADDIGVYVAAWDGFFQEFYANTLFLALNFGLVRYLRAFCEVSLWMGTGVYVAGERDSGAFVSKFATTGSLMWTRPLARTDQEINLPAALVADTTGIYLGGSTYRRVSWQARPLLPRVAKVTWRSLMAMVAPSRRSRFGPAGTGVGFWQPTAAGCTQEAACKTHCPVNVVWSTRSFFEGTILLVMSNRHGSSELQGTEKFAGRLTWMCDALYVSGIASRRNRSSAACFSRNSPRFQAKSDNTCQIIWECVVNAASYAGGAVTRQRS